MGQAAVAKTVMWSSGILATFTLLLYFGAKRENEQALIPDDLDAAPYFITLAICAVAFIAATIYAARGDAG